MSLHQNKTMPRKQKIHRNLPSRKSETLRQVIRTISKLTKRSLPNLNSNHITSCYTISNKILKLINYATFNLTKPLKPSLCWPKRKACVVKVRILDLHWPLILGPQLISKIQAQGRVQLSLTGHFQWNSELICLWNWSQDL